MKIDQYLKKEATQKRGESEIEEIFDRIRNHNIDLPKNKRPGNVFCSKSRKGRKHLDITEFTGLIFMDLDNCTDHIAVKELFTQLEHTRACWYSSSGVNVHALIKIPICQDVDEYKRRFRAFISVMGEYLEGIATIDKITSNPTQLAFESYDPEIYVFNAPTDFTDIEHKPEFIPIVFTERVSTTRREEWTLNWIGRSFRNITHPGYTQVLSFAKTLGGYCGGGYISKDVASSQMENSIRSNEYLNSNDSSGSIEVYVRDAKKSLDIGILAPIEWKKYH